MTKSPEQEAREAIDKMLEQADWDVQNVDQADIHAKKCILMDYPASAN